MSTKKRKDARCVMESRIMTQKMNKKTKKMEDVVLKHKITVKKSWMKDAQAAAGGGFKLRLKKYCPIVRKHLEYVQVSKK